MYHTFFQISISIKRTCFTIQYLQISHTLFSNQYQYRAPERLCQYCYLVIEKKQIYVYTYIRKTCVTQKIYTCVCIYLKCIHTRCTAGKYIFPIYILLPQNIFCASVNFIFTVNLILLFPLRVLSQRYFSMYHFFM